MWVDIFIAVILLFCMIKGFRAGFIRTVIDTAGWFVSVILGYFLSSPMINYVKENTEIYNNALVKVQDHIEDQGISALESIIEMLPQVIQDYFYKGISSISENMASSLIDIVLRIAAFLVIVLALKLVFKLLTALFSKKQQDGFIGAVDGITGCLTGLIKGIVISYLLLALFVPLSVSLDSTLFVEALDKSYAAKYLYDYNILLMVINKFTG